MISAPIGFLLSQYSGSGIYTYCVFIVVHDGNLAFYLLFRYLLRFEKPVHEVNEILGWVCVRRYLLDMEMYVRNASAFSIVISCEFRESLAVFFEDQGCPLRKSG